MTDHVTVATLLLAALPTTISSILGAVMTWKVFDNSSKLITLSNQTHDLVNGSMLIQLKLHAKTARSKADITGDKVDIAVAELAEEMLASHQAKLDKLDKMIEGMNSNKKDLPVNISPS
jgi:hypothetical protein